MSDVELDREWQPNNRPQSVVAQNFSLALNQLFKIDCSISDLDAAVCEKKKAVQTQTSELEALEARLRETEERLIQAGVDPSRISMIESSKDEIPLDVKSDEIATKSHTSKSKSSLIPAGQQKVKDDRSWKRPFRYNSSSLDGLPPTPDASEDGDSS